MKSLFRRKSVDYILEQLKNDGAEEHSAMNKVLGVRDLTALGIAAIIGAGIFSTVGKACFDGGPGVIFLFMITAVACGFSALCYAEFASRIPVSGSAYTYSYAVFGELVAWIIGWDLLMEYAIGNITVAISWSSNFSSFLNNMGLHLPGYLATSFMTAKKGFTTYMELKSAGAAIPESVTGMYNTWLAAPRLGGVPLILNLPALFITIIITYLVYVGIKESRTSTNLMVGFKLLVILVVITIGFFYVNPANWKPFAPNGFSGIMKGVSAVFFAYIGFDAISTTAEECRNPRRDLPLGMFYSLIICTLLYVLICLVLTGMVPYSQLNVGDFLASAFNARGLNWLGGILALSAVIATTSVLLVFQMGQPRIWMSMSRDGLLPPKFAKLHPINKTPGFSTILTGLIVGIPSLVMDSDLVTDLCSIGTLFAFILVCGGILFLPRQERDGKRFHLPYINGAYIIPLLLLILVVIIRKYNPGIIHEYLNFKGDWMEKIPYLIFVCCVITVTVATFIKKWSLIPVLGLLSCLYLMTELGITNWLRFLIWLIIGLVVYFSYGYKKSKLAKVSGRS